MEQLKEQLERLLAGDIDMLNNGICGNLSGNHKEVLQKHFKTWNHYSGDILYPVPDPEDKLTPRFLYYEVCERAIFLKEGNMWVGAYGELRLDLVRHILQELSKPSITERLIKWFKELI